MWSGDSDDDYRLEPKSKREEWAVIVFMIVKVAACIAAAFYFLS